MNNIEILISEDEINSRVLEIADAINNKYKNEELLVVGILKGSFVFMSDLIKRLNMPLEIDFMIVSSYSGTESTGNVNIIKDINNDITNKNILLVEDIVDTGLTLSNVRNLLFNRNPKNIEICTLIDKKVRRKVELEADYVGFNIGNEFIIGYGLDLDEKYRNLPYIGKIVN